VDFEEFSILHLPISLVLRFCQRMSKNWWIDITRCFTNRHLFVVNYLIHDVIDTFMEMEKHYFVD